MDNLSQLAYISRSNVTGSIEEVREEIGRILAVAVANNGSKDITGALLYSGGFFCQALEGDEDEVETLFESIQMDPRHRDVTVLHFESIDQRGFDDWSMALAGVEEERRFDLDGLKQSKDEIAARDMGRSLVEVLGQLVTQHQSAFDSEAGES